MRPEVVIALDERFGEPVDAYVNGSQTWLRDDGPGGMTLEWRLHPVAGFVRPPDVGVYELFSSVALALETGGTPPAPPERLWDGLEAFPGLRRRGRAGAAGVASAPRRSASHPTPPAWSTTRSIGDEWERSGGTTSIVTALLGPARPLAE